MLRHPLAALLVCATLPGCGGGGGDARPPAGPRLSDAEQAAATVRRQMQAVARGDGAAACGLFSARALQKVDDLVARRAADVGCATAVEQGSAGLSPRVRAALRRPRITRVEVSGGRARVRVRLPAELTELAGGAARGGLALRRNADGWRVDGPAR